MAKRRKRQAHGAPVRVFGDGTVVFHVPPGQRLRDHPKLEEALKRLASGVAQIEADEAPAPKKDQ